MIDDMREIEVVVAHSERVTLRVGDVSLKIDTDQARIDREVEVTNVLRCRLIALWVFLLEA